MTAVAVVFTAVGLITSPSPVKAYNQYSQSSGTATYCRACHGNFRASSYISPHDGLNWGNLHNLHRQTMLSGDCPTCHQAGGDFPVALNQSDGGTGLAAISCAGCHGRAEDNVASNPEVGAGRSGYGAGLRQHHYTTGTTVCATCHLDANPANYTPVGENVLPTYYAHPGTGHPLMPTESCNGNGSENFAGAPEGLDNDGDDLYDGTDSQCTATGVAEPAIPPGTAAVLFQNYPNPFVARTSIEYETSGATPAEIRILDVHGRLIRLLKSSSSSSGRHRLEWDGRDQAGDEMPSGVYVYELRSGDVRSRMTMVLLR